MDDPFFCLEHTNFVAKVPKLVNDSILQKNNTLVSSAKPIYLSEFVFEEKPNN